MSSSAVSPARPRGAIGRLFNFLSATLGSWVRDREQENPRAVYEQAIHGRLRRYALNNREWAMVDSGPSRTGSVMRATAL